MLAQAEGHIFKDSEANQKKCRLLKNHSAFAANRKHVILLAERGDVLAFSIRISPEVGFNKPTILLSSTDFPVPEVPRINKYLAASRDIKGNPF